MTKYQPFDWKNSIAQHSTETVNFIWNNHDKPMTEQEFFDGWCNLPLPRHNLGRAKHQYKKLKERFGFFTGEVSYRKKQ
jgi:hypothetical protein